MREYLYAYFEPQPLISYTLLFIYFFFSPSIRLIVNFNNGNELILSKVAMFLHKSWDCIFIIFRKHVLNFLLTEYNVEKLRRNVVHFD